MARKSKYEPETDIPLARGYAMEGMTREEIAGKLGIHRNTLAEWEKRYSAFRDALKVGRERTDFAVEQALLKKALKGDTVACIFWLKNRRPKQWKDRPQEDTGATGRKVDDLIQAAQELAKGIVDVHE